MVTHIKKLFGKYGNHGSPIFLFSLVVLFWTLFDSIMSYVAPLVMEEKGFSITMIGFVLGSSSVTGALFDFLISKVFKSTDFRRVFLVMFAICAVYPLLLWQAKTIWLFLFVMAVWGVYFDLYGFGVFNFVGRYLPKKDHSSGFGTVQMFRALGSMLAPLIVGLVIIDRVDWKSFGLGWFFLGVAGCLFLILTVVVRNHHPVEEQKETHRRRKNILTEIMLWKKLGKLMSPVLFITFYLFFVEAFFWTLAPLYAENSSLKQFGGLFLTAYTLPALFVGWFVGSLTKKFGKKRTALLGMLIGSILLASFASVSNPIVAIVIVFIASCFISVALPAVNAAYADYISEAPKVEGEIEGIEDFSFNISYVLGPILAGVVADVFSIPVAFSILGIIGVVISIIFLAITPKHITIKI